MGLRCWIIVFVSLNLVSGEIKFVDLSDVFAGGLLPSLDVLHFWSWRQKLGCIWFGDAGNNAAKQHVF